MKIPESESETNKKGVKIFNVVKKKLRICKICNKKFNMKSNLNTHIRSHSGKKSFKCSYPNCQKEFFTSGNLKSHQSIHLEKEHKCQICFKNFCSSTRLNVHKLIHLRFKTYFR